jgi:hypothetical protein
MVSNERAAFSSNYKKHIDGEMMSYYLGWKGDSCNWEIMDAHVGLRKDGMIETRFIGLLAYLDSALSTVLCGWRLNSVTR